MLRFELMAEGRHLAEADGTWQKLISQLYLRSCQEVQGEMRTTVFVIVTGPLLLSFQGFSRGDMGDPSSVTVLPMESSIHRLSLGLCPPASMN